MNFKSQQDLFFEIWSILLDQLNDNSKPERLEEFLGFSCLEEDFLELSLNKINDLIDEGIIDINIPFYIHPPRGKMYIKGDALRQTIQHYNFGYRNKYVYNNMDSKDYLEELIYFLIEHCQPDIDTVKFIVGHKKLYKILEELLKRFDGKIDLLDYKIESRYLEILVGFSCLELDKKIIYSYRKYHVLPIESLLIEYIFLEFEEEESNNFYKDRGYKDSYNVYKRRKTEIINNIFLLKKYSPEPSYEDVLRSVKKECEIYSKFINFKEEDITNHLTDIFNYFKL